jgi:hypothetical protein
MNFEEALEVLSITLPIRFEIVFAISCVTFRLSESPRLLFFRFAAQITFHCDPPTPLQTRFW